MYGDVCSIRLVFGACAKLETDTIEYSRRLVVRWLYVCCSLCIRFVRSSYVSRPFRIRCCPVDLSRPDNEWIPNKTDAQRTTNVRPTDVHVRLCPCQAPTDRTDIAEQGTYSPNKKRTRNVRQTNDKRIEKMRNKIVRRRIVVSIVAFNQGSIWLGARFYSRAVIPLNVSLSTTR